jgi:septum formation protein
MPKNSYYPIFLLDNPPKYVIKRPIITVKFIQNSKQKLVLASSSPRRKQLLEEIGLNFDILPADIDEDINKGESPEELTLRLAEKKAKTSAKNVKNSWVIGADTIVYIDNRILGKPTDIHEARKMLLLLSGRCHKVATAFCFFNSATGEEIKRVAGSMVKIKNLTNKEIEDYLKSGEPFDKAGAYAVQGIGGFMVEKIEGSYTNVVGLPMEEFQKVLEETGIIQKVMEVV